MCIWKMYRCPKCIVVFFSEIIFVWPQKMCSIHSAGNTTPRKMKCIPYPTPSKRKILFVGDFQHCVSINRSPLLIVGTSWPHVKKNFAFPYYYNVKWWSFKKDVCAVISLRPQETVFWWGKALKFLFVWPQQMCSNHSAGNTTPGKTPVCCTTQK